VGHRITGDRRARTRGIGWEFVHVAIDDASRLAYVEVLGDETGVTATKFLWRALAWFRRHGIRVRRVMTDNGSGYRADGFAPSVAAPACAISARVPIRRARMARLSASSTLLREWAYRRAYPTSQQRAEALPAWLYYYNGHRGHSALRGRAPLSILAAPNNLVAVHT